MKLWKKIIFVIMALSILNLGVIGSYEQAKASVVSKPLTITAKKVAKDLATDSAVSMANEIVSKYLVRDLIEGVGTDAGFAPVCMSGSTQTMDDCPEDKRAQVKRVISGNDKSLLSQKAEQVVEQKTNTSSKWGKFLDWFVPVFLVSGLVSYFSSVLDGDSESLIDEIALQALIDAGLLKPLNDTTVEVPVYDFASVVQSVGITRDVGTLTSEVRFEIKMKPEASMVMNGVYSDNGRAANMSYQFPKGATSYIRLNWSYASQYHSTIENKIHYKAVISATGYGTGTGSGSRGYQYLSRYDLYHGDIPYPTQAEVGAFSQSYMVSYIGSLFGTADINTLLNNYLTVTNGAVSFNVGTVPKPPPVPIDYGAPKGLEGTKNPDGTNDVKGINSFIYIYNDTYVYPSDDSTTGWKDKTTGEDIPIPNPDDVIVEEGTTEVPPGEEEPEEPLKACQRNLKDIEFKKVGTAFTNAFPFSIPWDIKRFIDNAFSGVGSEKPSVDLDFLGDGVTLTIPTYFDRWIGFVHGLLIIVFDIALVYLFYRFMKGGGD